MTYYAIKDKESGKWLGLADVVTKENKRILKNDLGYEDCMLGKDFAISISSDAFVGFVASMSKNSFGVIPK